MFKALYRCICRFFGRIKPKQRDTLQRRTDHGANIDIEEALAEELEIQRRSGRVLSSTASIAAALRHRPRDAIPVFSTQWGNDEHRDSSDLATKSAVEETQSLIPNCIGQTHEKHEVLKSAKSPMFSQTAMSSRISSSPGSSFKIPESVPEDIEPENEMETNRTIVAATERLSEMNPRRSSIFDMRSEWI
ncbi:unnamed protein product [Peronospora farinosa]|uniref:Uncharacterized protein n=1 Tax=Peronospora farinosa TaxID=134698 RepID=A0AAV0SRB6_9STRA|nr:unnamed protein product [Peronospora farinosa]CAI5704211.1 unnamed protein product [Peronospora farinosa]